jgi:N-methylhydantoinase A/oxoprolinase/acetone carboxylase beta subunit
MSTPAGLLLEDGRPTLREEGTDAPRSSLRVGVDVGGTFTKAVAVDAEAHRVRAHSVVPTTHTAGSGVTAGVADALRSLLQSLGDERGAVQYVAFSTTQAMNALLEGDVARVGVIGMGAGRELRAAGRRSRVGSVKLAAGRELHTEHELLDVTGGLSTDDARAALQRLAARGCQAIAISGAYSVDDPEAELEVAAIARELGLPACCGHELSGAYGLETRTVSAAINAAVLPVIETTAGVVEDALRLAGVAAPLLVLRGDGGAMSTESFRRRPSFTIGSGPAAGVAAALHQLEVSDAIVLECGGTSSNISVVRRGRPVLRSLRVMGRPTSIRSVDSWVVGAAGGSLARLGRRRLAEVGPRSAHIAGLPYACFAPPEQLLESELRLEAIAPRPGDPAEYACVVAGDRRFALTATCAANALGLIPEASHAHGEAALAAFALLGRRLRTTPEEAARALLDGAVEKIAEAALEARRFHEISPQAPLVALGGAADALAPEVARRLGVELVRPEHPEVLSSIGAALSLVRAEVARTATAADGPAAKISAARQAERECVEAGASPATVATEAAYDPVEGIVRAVATGAVQLETGAAARHLVGEEERRRAAASALRLDAERLTLAAGNDFYRVYRAGDGPEGAGAGRGWTGPVAVVDQMGGVPLAEEAKGLLVGEGEELLEQLAEAVEGASVNLGVATMLPRVSLICGPHITDLSDARRGSEILAAARRAISEHDGSAVVLLAG